MQYTAGWGSVYAVHGGVRICLSVPGESDVRMPFATLFGEEFV